MKYLITLLILACASSVPAQDLIRDVVYLNNGSIIRGNIIEITGNKTLKIESCENILVFDMSEIQKITREEYEPVRTADLLKTDGYINITSFGVLAGPVENSGKAPLSIETVNAYRLNSRYSFGIGIGMELFEKAHVPLFLDCRYLLMKRNVSPFILIKGGYALPVGGDSETDTYTYQEQYSKGGPLMGTGAGLQFRLNEHNLIIMSLSYRYQQLTTTEIQRNGDNKWEYDHSVKYNRLELKFGFCFD
jgi:hypothetical protein